MHDSKYTIAKLTHDLTQIKRENFALRGQLSRLRAHRTALLAAVLIGVLVMGCSLMNSCIRHENEAIAAYSETHGVQYLTEVSR